MRIIVHIYGDEVFPPPPAAPIFDQEEAPLPQKQNVKTSLRIFDASSSTSFIGFMDEDYPLRATVWTFAWLQAFTTDEELPVTAATLEDETGQAFVVWAGARLPWVSQADETFATPPEVVAIDEESASPLVVWATPLPSLRLYETGEFAPQAAVVALDDEAAMLVVAWAVGQPPRALSDDEALAQIVQIAVDEESTPPVFLVLPPLTPLPTFVDEALAILAGQQIDDESGWSAPIIPYVRWNRIQGRQAEDEFVPLLINQAPHVILPAQHRETFVGDARDVFTSGSRESFTGEP